MPSEVRQQDTCSFDTFEAVALKSKGRLAVVKTAGDRSTPPNSKLLVRRLAWSRPTLRVSTLPAISWCSANHG